MEEYSEFRDTVKKVNKPRVHKITNSIGVYDLYKLIRKNKWPGINLPVTEKDFYAIIRGVNSLMAKELLNGKEISFPHRLGTLEVRKKPARVSIINNTLVTNLPIDWDATLKLWYEDEESYLNKTLVRCENEEIFKIIYSKRNANYKNKSYYEFRPTRALKNQLTRLVREGNLDAYLINYYE